MQGGRNIKNKMEKIAKDLIKLIEEIPLVLQPELKLVRRLKNSNSGLATYANYAELTYRGAVRRCYDKYVIGLAFEFSNMGETLVHEVLHIRFQEVEDEGIKELTKDYWANPEVRKASQKRIVQRLGDYNL